MARDHNWHTWNLDFTDREEFGFFVDGRVCGMFSGSVSMAENRIEAIILDSKDGGSLMIKPDHELFPFLKEAILRTPWMLERIANWREEVAA